MSRNYEKESAWEKEKYERIVGKIDKELGIDFKNALKNNGTNFSQWLTNEAKKYLKK